VGVATPLVAPEPEDFGVESQVALGDPQPPPRILLSVPPLARLINAILTGLNEVRRCLFPSLFNPLRERLDETLKQAKTVLMTNEKIVLKPGQPKELRQAMASLVEHMDRVVDPYARGSLEAALGCRETAENYHGILRKNLAKEVPVEPDVLDQAKASAEEVVVASAGAETVEEAGQAESNHVDEPDAIGSVEDGSEEVPSPTDGSNDVATNDIGDDDDDDNEVVVENDAPITTDDDEPAKED
jgi:hypothetical protein